MHPLKTLGTWLKKKAFDPMEGLDITKIGWHSVGGSGTYGFYKSNQYENGYSSISKLANGFALIEQYTIDKTGKSVASNILDRLYTPNTDMSAYDFREALAVMTLVHDKVRLRVHHTGTRINANSITGFTFMENYSETIVDGKRRYRLQNGDVLTDDEVVTLKSINPDDVTEGFSPSRAARRWTTLDDYIADYQRGFFENGAVPSGQMIVTARTSGEFNDIVDMLQAKHRGAGKNNNITYAHRPTDQDGKPLNSQIEWVPFSTPNKDMALKDLFDNANKKIDSSFGVPASIRGVNDQNTYASVRVDEVIFVKYALSPMTLKIWSKFTHELTRITGGMGVAITYDLEIPQIADEEKVKAEARQIDATTLSTLLQEGYTIKSAVEYIKTGDLDALQQNTVPIEDKPEILDAEEAKGTPDQPIDGYAKAVKVKQLSESDRESYEAQLSSAVKARLEEQVNNVISNLDQVSKAISEDNPLKPDEDAKLTEGMWDVLQAAVINQGIIEHPENIELVFEAGISTENIRPFFMNSSQRADYRAYVNKVATYFNEQTAEKIRNILIEGHLQQLTAQQIKDNLSSILAEQWRIDRLAVSEVNRAGNEASLMSMKNIAQETGAIVEKEWFHGGGDDPCEFCRALIGTTVPLNDAFVDLNGVVKGADGGTYVNNFVAADVAEIHPNGHCRQVYRVRRV